MIAEAAGEPEAVPVVEWEQVEWERLRARRDEVMAAVKTVRDAVDATSGDSDEVPSAGGGALSLRERVGVRGKRGSADLLDALVAGSVPRTAAAAAALAGLGEGSTPAGDDYLVGAMYALRALLPAADPLCAAIAEAAGPRTTRLSAMWLQRAAVGDAIPTWSFFLASLAEPERDTTRDAIAGVLALGHTSGRAALTGFAATVDALGVTSR